MRRHHHLFVILRRAVASSASQRAQPLPLLHSVALRNGAAGSFSPCFFSSRARSSVGAAKSLVEDEAELSDWISDLKTDSFHLGLSSGDEGDAPSTRRSSVGSSRGGRGGSDSRGSFPRSSTAGGEFSGDRRGGFEQRGRMISSGLDDADSGFGSSRGRRGRGERSSGFVRRGGRGNGFDEEATFRSPREQRSQRGRASGVARRGGRYSDFDQDDGDTGFGSSRGRHGASGQLSVSSHRRGRVSDLDDDEDSDDDLVGFGDLDGKQHHGRRKGGRENTVGLGRGRGRRDLGLSRKGGSYSDFGDYDDGRRRTSDLLQRTGRGSDLDDDEDDDAGPVGFDGYSVRQQGGRRGKMAKSVGPHRGGRGSDTDFGHRQPRGLKKIDFGLSEDDDEVGEVDEEDEPSGFEDDLFEDEGDKEDVGHIIGNKSGSSMLPEDEPAKNESVQGRSAGGGDSYLSQKRFDECPLSPLSLKGVKAAGYERMTAVQEATLPIILQGKDVLAKAKTGTGKTVAFLLPAIEVVSKLPPVDRDLKKPPISVVVVCPTRELADQAAAEANKLLKFHPSIGVQLVIGGTRMALEQKRMHTNPCQILVATPGRLRDHMENTPGFATRLLGVKVLILDEADRLLDMGFRSDIEKIVAALPKQRQTLLFSATVPDEVRQVCHIAMKRDLEFVNTVQEGSEETHSQVKQMHLIAPLDKQFSNLYGLLTDHISENVDYKVIVFCTTAKVTSLVAELLSELKLNVREIHSRKPQSYRTRISKEFKESKGLILVSSDVSARGVDYPNVTLVVQLGVPTDREQYIHRLGRTGRRGNEGTGILLLAPWEEYFLRSINDLPITEATQPLIDLDTKKKVDKALAHVEVKDKESAYQAWLGYYNSNKVIGRDKYQLVSLANEFSRSMGLNNPPAVSKLALRKMGLNNIPGLRSK